MQEANALTLSDLLSPFELIYSSLFSLFAGESFDGRFVVLPCGDFGLRCDGAQTIVMLFRRSFLFPRSVSLVAVFAPRDSFVLVLASNRLFSF